MAATASIGWRDMKAIATIFLGPVALFLERITLSLDLYGIGLTYTSATMGAATTNCLPVITFFLAVLVRYIRGMENKDSPGDSKANWRSDMLGRLPTNHRTTQSEHITSHRPPGIHISCIIRITVPSDQAFLTIPVHKTNISCPSQSFAIAILVERRPSQWMLGWNVRLLAVAYCGIVVTGVAYYLQAYAIEKKGPVFLALWTPLGLILTMLCSVLLLGEIITLGRSLEIERASDPIQRLEGVKD
uniref:WAT1-related protein n=1 Tax=Chenopodium quinoa TaxID=63459 RepID=A0A803KX72_CHEQI